MASGQADIFDASLLDARNTPLPAYGSVSRCTSAALNMQLIQRKASFGHASPVIWGITGTIHMARPCPVPHCRSERHHRRIFRFLCVWSIFFATNANLIAVDMLYDCMHYA